MTTTEERARPLMAGHGWVVPLPDGAKARCMGPPGCAVCVAEWEALNAAQVERCRCGRDLRRLNPVSDTVKCVGCGFPSELCTCEDVPR